LFFDSVHLQLYLKGLSRERIDRPGHRPDGKIETRAHG
jgi:hypothetical protein